MCPPWGRAPEIITLFLALFMWTLVEVISGINISSTSSSSPFTQTYPANCLNAKFINIITISCAFCNASIEMICHLVLDCEVSQKFRSHFQNLNDIICYHNNLENVALECYQPCYFISYVLYSQAKMFTLKTRTELVASLNLLLL